MASIGIGDWIEHASEGIGQVERITFGGRSLMVRFENRTGLTVIPLFEAVKVNSDGTRTGQVPIPVASRKVRTMLPEGKEGELLALRLVEALRTGVAPGRWAHLYSIGRDTELALVDCDLRQCHDGGAVRVFLGDYGTGKTHMLDLVRERALQDNFVVARAVLDETEVSPSHPQRVYRALIDGISYPDCEDAEGLYHLFQRAVELHRLQKSASSPLQEDYNLKENWPDVDRVWLANLFSRDKSRRHEYLTPALLYFERLTSSELLGNPYSDELIDHLLNYIEGRSVVSNKELNDALRQFTGINPGHIFAVRDQKTLAHLYAYILGGIAALSRAAGYTGLVLLLDEAEMAGLLSSQAQDLATYLFGYYAASAVGSEGVRFNIDEAPRGGQRVHRAFPPVFRTPSNIYCVFAMTNEDRGKRLLEKVISQSAFCDLAHIQADDCRKLCRSLVDLYLMAYPGFSLGGDIEKPMGDMVYRGVTNGKFATPRLILKFIIETLDMSRLCRSKIVHFVTEFRERIG